MINEKNGILLPLDGSVTATAALGAAQAMTMAMDGVLHIVHVSDRTLPTPELLEELKVEYIHMKDFVLHQESGDIVEVIVDLVARDDIRMLVMSSHGHTFDERLLMGRIGTEIIQRSPDPVMVIRPDMHELPRPSWRPQKMLIPLDGSPSAAAATETALELAEMLGCQVDVVHIAMTGKKPPQEAGSMTTPRYLDYSYYEWAAWANEFMTRFAKQPPSVMLRLLHRQGIPAEEMMKLAMESREDLIVLGWQGNLDPDRARTIKELLKKTEVPVILIKTG